MSDFSSSRFFTPPGFLLGFLPRVKNHKLDKIFSSPNMKNHNLAMVVESTNLFEVLIKTKWPELTKKKLLITTLADEKLFSSHIHSNFPLILKID